MKKMLAAALVAAVAVWAPAFAQSEKPVVIKGGHQQVLPAGDTLDLSANPLNTNITGAGAQCVQASSSGVLSGTGAACGSGGGGGGTVTTTGTPASGNLAKFSGATSITNGDLSGDCTTSGALSLTCTKLNGVSPGYFFSGTDAANLTGTVSVNRFNSGTGASASTFLRGDGIWAAPTAVLPTIASGYVLGNASAGSATATGATLTALLDVAFGSIQGMMLYRDASGWAALASGSPGQVLQTNGAGVNPAWVTPTGGSVVTGVPGTIPDLLYWFETTNIKASAGAVLQNMQNLNPWYPGQFAAASPSGTGAGPTIDATTLAGYPVLNTAGTSASRYGWGTPSSNAALLHASTIFIVFKPNTVSVTQAFVGGTAGALEFRINSTGNLELLKASTASIGTSSSTVNTSNWYQANATYNDSTGAYAFRIGRAAAGSGTNVQAITVTTGGILWNNGSNPEDLNSKFVALIIYNRVLSGAEITSVENYLNAKYGV